MAAIDRQLDDYDAVLQNIPHGSRLLPLVMANADYTRVDAYGQYEFWHLIENDGRVPGIWSFVDASDPDHPIYLRHLQHFVPIWRAHSWNGILPPDWQRIASDYDYIVLVTDDAELTGEVRSHARWNLEQSVSIARPAP